VFLWRLRASVCSRLIGLERFNRLLDGHTRLIGKDGRCSTHSRWRCTLPSEVAQRDAAIEKVLAQINIFQKRDPKFVDKPPADRAGHPFPNAFMFDNLIDRLSDHAERIGIVWAIECRLVVFEFINDKLPVCVVVTFGTGGAEIQRRVWPIWLVDTRRRFCGVASAGVRGFVV
jgi:hypothetical protein